MEYQFRKTTRNPVSPLQTFPPEIQHPAMLKTVSFCEKKNNMISKRGWFTLRKKCCPTKKLPNQHEIQNHNDTMKMENIWDKIS